MENQKTITITVTEEDLKDFKEVTQASNKTPEEGLKEYVKNTAETIRFIKLIRKSRETKGE